VGNGSIEDALRPTKVPIVGVAAHGAAASATHQKSAPTPQFIVSLNVGLRHTLVLSSSQQLFGWGMVNLTNGTANCAPGSFVSGGVPSCESSVASSPSNANSRRRFSVFCDSTSTSELYLTPTQIFYASGVHNPFSGGKFLQLRGCSSGSLGYAAIDAEVPLTVEVPSTGASQAGDGAKKSPLKAAAATVGPEGATSPTKAKLSTTAHAVRRALLFTSPPGRSPLADSEQSSFAGSSVADRTSAQALSPKPQFNPFLKDYSSKKDEQVRPSEFLLFDSCVTC
jgi:hypothetical protein